MANTTRRNWQMPLAERELSVDQDQRYDQAQGTRVSWGGIWAGVLTALGTLLLLSTLGLAVGIAANAGAGAAGAAGVPGAGNVNPGTVGTAAVIWSALSLLIAMYLGGLASTRMGQISDRGSGMFHGGLVWVIALGAMLYLGLRGLELMGAGAAMGLGGAGGAGAAGAAGDAANQAANAAAAHPGATTGIGWSPFIISALSLLAALAGAASGLRHRLFDDSSGGSTRLYDDSRNRYDTRYDDTTRSTTTTTTTRDRDRY